MILDDKAKTIHMFELTCPSEHNIEQRHTEKSNKYAHFTTDISEYKCKVDAFEVSSKGFLTSRNHTTLATLHKYINPLIKLRLSRRIFLHCHSLPLTTSSTASPSLPLWNNHFSCHQSRSNHPLHCLQIITTFFCLYCSQVGAPTCPGPVHLCVLTLYLVAHVLRRPCLFVIENKHDFCNL